MSIEIKKFERATKVWQKIKVIDTQIGAVVRMAELATNNDVKVTKGVPQFQIAVPDPTHVFKKQRLIPDKDGNVFIDGELMPYEMAVSLDLVIPITEPEQIALFTIHYSITENLTLKILAVFLQDLKDRKQALLKTLQSYGIKQPTSA